MLKMMEKIPGVTHAFQGNGIVRQEQIRYSFEELKKKYDIGSEDMNCRMGDYGIPWFWSSHHPWVIPEPMTIEPCESYTKEDIEEYCKVVEICAKETCVAYGKGINTLGFPIAVSSAMVVAPARQITR